MLKKTESITPFMWASSKAIELCYVNLIKISFIFYQICIPLTDWLANFQTLDTALENHS